MTKDLLFIIPMKDPAQGKSRLAAVLPAAARERLAMALFRQVLAFLGANQPSQDVLVVTGSEQVKSAAGEYGAQTLAEEGQDLSSAITQAARWAKGQYRTICVLPADLADPDADDLAQLLNYPREKAVTIAPSHDGGTNCLIVSPPDAIDFHYGPDSCRAHQDAAVAHGLACTIAPLSSFAYDIDTSDDLARFSQKAGDTWA